MKLDDQQRQRVNEVLRYRGEKCPLCGSPALASNGVYYVGPSGRISVQYACLNRDDAEQHPTGFGPFSIALDPNEARRIGRG